MEVNYRENKRIMEPIAIIGMGCRFPDRATSTDEFWKMLCDGIDAISEIPEDRWSIANYYDPNRAKKGKANTCWGGFLKKIDEFDAEFFGISPREAAMLDPQQRVLLEVCYEALEDGGQVVKELAGSKTGVFMGGFTLDWKLLQFSESNRNLIDSHSATGSMMTLLSNRISYVFDLCGPSISVDTACSSSLVAVHMACQSIWNNESEMALAGGVNIMLKPDYFIAESKAGMLSPDGRCKTYDSSANGYVRGEGAGVVLLKPLSKAIQDKDIIQAVIRGTGCNQDGHTSGITVPNSDSQIALMRSVYKQAGVLPSEIQYVEAHGTGTPVGDPIEARAIGTVLSENRQENKPCIVSSVKTYMGHLEAAAGIAGLIKTVLCIKNGMIPKHLHLKNPNPKIDFDGLKLMVPRENIPWPETDGIKRAGVNSFGFGGTNAHVLVEEYIAVEQKDKLNDTKIDNNKTVLLPISARSKESLQEFAKAIKELGCDNTYSLESLGLSLSKRRDHHNHRLAIAVRTKDELEEMVDAFISGGMPVGLSTGVVDKQVPPLAFVFTGMGPQWWAMGRQLIDEEPVFRETIENVDKCFKRLSGWSLLDAMLAEEDVSEMNETKLAQPANFAIQVALVDLLKSWGIEPDVIIGHSAGEAAAAYAAGAMSFEDAVKVIYTRSRLQQLTTGQGRMVAVGLAFEEAEELIKGYDLVSIAAINSPSAVTLSGDPDALQEIVTQLEAKSVFCKYLHVKVPYHSHYMQPLKNELLESLSDIKLKQTTIPLYSTVTGQLINGEELNAQYWWKNIRESVFFADGCREMIKDGYSVFLEIGPHPVLASSIKECLTAEGKEGVTFSCLKRKENESLMLLSTLGALYTHGYNIAWEKLFSEDSSFVKLPTYPWNRERYWQETIESKIDRLGSDTHPLLGNRVNSPVPIWERDLNTYHVSYLEDHKIQSAVTFPGAGYVEMSLAVVRELYGDTAAINVEDVEFRKAMFLPDEKIMKIRFMYDKKDSSFGIYSQPVDVEDKKEWTLNTTGKVFPTNKNLNAVNSIAGYRERCTKQVSKEDCYKQFEKLGLVYGETFRGIKELWQGTDEALANVEICNKLEDDIEKYSIHPALLDICFQVLAAALPFAGENEKAKVYMPTGVEAGSVVGKLKKHMYIYAKINEKNGDYLKGDIVLMDEDGQVILKIHGCKAVSLNDQSQSNSREQGYYEYKWLRQERKDAKQIAPVNQKSNGTWLVFADDKGIAKAFTDILAKKDVNVLTVHAGESFEVKDSRVIINPKLSEHYDKLFSEIVCSTENECEAIVNFWNIDTAKTSELNYELLERAQELGTHSVLFLVQAMAKQKWNSMPRLWLITNGSQQVLDKLEAVNVAQAAVWGMGRVIGHQEHMDLFGGMIDIDSVSPVEELENVYMEVWNTDGEDQVAFRGGERYVARMVESADLNKPVPVKLESNASYLITGGFGSLGLLIARWMIERGARRLILMGRSELPVRSQWSTVDPNSSVANRIKAIQELESMGASVHVAATDVTNYLELKEYVDTYYADGWPAIKGVVHSAGVAIPQLMNEMDISAFDRVLRPKVMGAWNLHKIFEKEQLDFFVLFSSVAALIVSGGQSNYSAGNAFMDALANYRHAIGIPGISINWGPWAEVGMATQLDLLTYFIKRGLYPMTPDQGLNAFEHIIGQNASQVAVIGADWPEIGDKNYPMGIYPAMVSDLIAKQSEASNEPKKANNLDEKTFLDVFIQIQDENERMSMFQEYLLDIVALVLRLNREKMESNQSLNSWGLDSMMAIELKNRIEKNLKVEIAVVDLLKGPTIEGLASQLMPKIEEHIILIENEDTGDLIKEINEMSTEELEKLLQTI